jgi:hypothetical protein
MTTIEYSYKHPDLDVPIECTLDCEPPQRGAREHGTGLQLEPDYDASAELTSARVGGVEIITLLSEDLVYEIQSAALRHLQEPCL